MRILRKRQAGGVQLAMERAKPRNGAACGVVLAGKRRGEEGKWRRERRRQGNWGRGSPGGWVISGFGEWKES